MAKYSNYASLQGKKSLKSTLIIEPIFFKLKKKKKKKKNTTLQKEKCYVYNIFTTLSQQILCNRL